MNAYQLHEAAFDLAQSEFATETARYVQEYANGAFDLYVSAVDAQKIIDCRAAYKAAFEKDGQYSFHHDDCIRHPLEEIELNE